MKILAIVGSQREESYNLQLAKAAQAVLAKKHPSVEFEVLDWSEVPLFNQDQEHPAPKAVVQAREKTKKADGIWLFSPEYNHSYPGALKNLIDWLSRPVNTTEAQVLRGKPVALAGASPGMSGTAHAQDDLSTLLGFLQADIMQAPRLVIPHVAQQSDERGRLSLTGSANYLEAQATAFIDFISTKR